LLMFIRMSTFFLIKKLQIILLRHLQELKNTLD